MSRLIETLNLDNSKICRLNTCHNLWMILYILTLLGLASIVIEKWMRKAKNLSATYLVYFIPKTYPNIYYSAVTWKIAYWYQSDFLLLVTILYYYTWRISECKHFQEKIFFFRLRSSLLTSVICTWKNKNKIKSRYWKKCKICLGISLW